MKRLNTLVFNNPKMDHPASHLRAVLNDHLMDGCTVHPKFTCEHCNERVFANIANEFPVFMECPKCGGMHDFDKSGGNYSLGQFFNPTEDCPDPLTAFKLWRKDSHGY